MTKLKNDKEIKEQFHEDDCHLHNIGFRKRTSRTCDCEAKERYQEEFLERRKGSAEQCNNCGDEVIPVGFWHADRCPQCHAIMKHTKMA